MYPVSTGRAQCRWCEVDIWPNKWRLCESCEKDAICLECGKPITEYQGKDICLECYIQQPFSFQYRLVKKGGRQHGTVAK